MAEAEYPRAWGVLLIDVSDVYHTEIYWADVFHCRESADEFLEQETTPDISGEIIELIPRPVHERLVAEAVAAERAAELERCAAIAGEVAESCRPANRSYMDAFEREAYDTAQLIADKIREVQQ